jgi:hypothetical protein
MTDDERATITRFKAMIDLIRCGSDGYALPDQGLELEALSNQMLRVDVALVGKSGPAELSALHLADATAKWVAEMISGRRDPDIAERWFKARAKFIEPE